MSGNPGSLKRKHSSKTIKELFTTQSKPNVAVAPQSPTSKRTRRESSPTPGTGLPISSATSGNMSTADMYHFPSKRADGPGKAAPIDLTNSPDGSPAKINGQRNGMRKSVPNTNTAAGPKRLQVKNFKVTRKVDPSLFLDQTWQKLDKALDTIFQQGEINFSLEELYRGVENVCRQQMAQQICDRLITKCKAYVGGALKAKVKESLGRTNIEVLKSSLHAWTVWNSQVVCKQVFRQFKSN